MVPALVRGFAILDLIGKNPGLDFTAIHTRLRLPKSSAHNLLTTLSQLGVIRIQPDRGFVLGLKLTELGNFAAAQRFSEAEFLPLLRNLAARTAPHLPSRRDGRARGSVSLEGGMRPSDPGEFLGRQTFLAALLGPWQGSARLAAGNGISAQSGADYMDTEHSGIQSWTQVRCARTCNRCAHAAGRRMMKRMCRTYAASQRRSSTATDTVVAAISAVGTIFQVEKGQFEILAPRLIEVANEISHRAFGT